ncbi:MAG: 2OG-Fe(II) oxygenase [Proteobacteria bacterium]|nr:2OG-Fe(II) oxygenase [Pseudomonadota bacterium]
MSTLQTRRASVDAEALGAMLDERGYACIPALLSAKDCAALTKRYEEETGFRSRVIMARHGFGQGEYKYFDNPLPDVVQRLREGLYAPLAAIANRWNEALGLDERFPPDLGTYLDHCHAAGQTRPTPLLLRYGPGDHNRLHQDLYGDEVFPLQATILLSDPHKDFTGGEFVLTEQRPRQQTRVEVVPLRRGDAVIFPVRHRPVSGFRGFYRATMRHGVSRLHAGSRTTLGVIFHDAA